MKRNASPVTLLNNLCQKENISFQIQCVNNSNRTFKAVVIIDENRTFTGIERNVKGAKKLAALKALAFCSSDFPLKSYTERFQALCYESKIVDIQTNRWINECGEYVSIDILGCRYYDYDQLMK